MKAGGAPNWTNGPVPNIAPEYMPSLLAASSDLALIVSCDGHIVSVLNDENSPHHASLVAWIGKPLVEILSLESRPKFNNAMTTLKEEGEYSRSVEVTHLFPSREELPVRYTFHRVGSEDAMLMLGKDLSLVAETQQQLIQAQIALERGYEERREQNALYRVIKAASRDSILILGWDGCVRDASAPAASVLGFGIDDLVDTSVDQVFQLDDGNALVDTLREIATPGFENDIVVRAMRGAQSVKIAPSVVRVAGEKLLVCRMSRAKAKMSADGDDELGLTAMFQNSPDGMVLCDEMGVISDANEAFADLAGLVSLSKIRSCSLAEFLQQGELDLSALLDGARRKGHLQNYQARLVNDVGPQASVEISSIHLSNEHNPSVAFIFRDADRAAVARQATQSADQRESSDQKVVELVGSATLKEIVAETTDVIEKICIETAVDLTRNNKVAAAEMLGLSRQSLYVKLRKYGYFGSEE